MRIFQIINHFGLNRGGAERVARKLHLELCSRGVDAHLVALEKCSTEGLDGATSLGFSSPYDPRVLPTLLKFMRRAVVPGDLVHAHLFPSSAYVALAQKLGRLDQKCLFTEHSTHNKRRETLIGGAVDRAVYSEFRKLIAISQGTRESLLCSYPHLAERTVVVPNGIEMIFDSPLTRAATKCPVILSVGRLTSSKNLDGALRAMAKIGNVPYQYIVLGEGAERRHLENLSMELGVNSRVTFKGHVSNIQPYLEMADIFLMPSRWEGFGLAAVEAMNATLPVIAGDVPGLREVIGSDGESGLLVSPDNPTEIRDALTTLMGQRELRSKMGLRGFKRAKQFTSKKMAESYIDIYRDLGLAGT